MERLLEFEDEVLGTFTLDNNEYRAEIDWLGTPVEIHILNTDPDNLQKTLVATYRFFDDQPHWDDYLRRAATDQLLDTKNNEWLEEEEREIEYTEFYERISLISIFVKTNGKFEAMLDDDDIFRGNLIAISGDTEGNVVATITDL